MQLLPDPGVYRSSSVNNNPSRLGIAKVLPEIAVETNRDRYAITDPAPLWPTNISVRHVPPRLSCGKAEIGDFDGRHGEETSGGLKTYNQGLSSHGHNHAARPWGFCRMTLQFDFVTWLVYKGSHI